MKQTEYTIKVVTEGTIDMRTLTDPISKIPGVKSAEVTTFRAVPKSKSAGKQGA